VSNPRYVPFHFTIFLAAGIVTGFFLTRHNEKHYSHFYSPKDLLCILLQNKISEKNGRVRFRGRVLSVGNQRTEGEIFVSLEVDSIPQSCFYGDSIWTKTSLYKINAPRKPRCF
jgi:hypothetical protein